MQLLLFNGALELSSNLFKSWLVLFFFFIKVTSVLGEVTLRFGCFLSSLVHLSRGSCLAPPWNQNGCIPQERAGVKLGLCLLKDACQVL